MNETGPTLSFIVPVRNDAERLRLCLASIRVAASRVRSEIIVADNGSTDDSTTVAHEAGARVLSVPGVVVAEARNRASRVARGPLLAFVDADHELAPGWAEAAIDLLGDSTVAAVGAQYHAPHRGIWVQQMYDRLRRHRTGAHAVDWLPSGNLVIRRNLFEALGGFDAGLQACEDVDLCQRLRDAGGQLIASDALWTVHHGDPSTLKALFWGELWRGRDNLRVSFRTTPSLRSIPSIAIPIINLIAIAMLVVGLVTMPFGGLQLAVVAIGTAAALSVLRATSLLLHSPTRSSGGVVIQAVVFSVVYDMARALALVLRTSHAARKAV